MLEAAGHLRVVHESEQNTGVADAVGSSESKRSPDRLGEPRAHVSGSPALVTVSKPNTPRIIYGYH